MCCIFSDISLEVYRDGKDGPGEKSVRFSSQEISLEFLVLPQTFRENLSKLLSLQPLGFLGPVSVPFSHWFPSQNALVSMGAGHFEECSS